MSDPSPYQHACDIGTISYEHVNEGLIFCRVCKKQWKFISGWRADPLVRRKP